MLNVFIMLSLSEFEQIMIRGRERGVLYTRFVIENSNMSQLLKIYWRWSLIVDFVFGHVVDTARIGCASMLFPLVVV